MAKLAAKSLLGVVIACVASGVLSAQDPQALFKEAVQLLRLNKKEEALAKFQEVVRLDPTNEQAWKLWSETDKNIWEELVVSNDAEIRKIAQHLMGRARLARKKMSRDDAVISDLAKKVCSADYEVRFKALTSLRADHGEFAVPALLTYLGNIDDEKGQSYATIAPKRCVKQMEGGEALAADLEPAARPKKTRTTKALKSVRRKAPRKKAARKSRASTRKRSS